MQMQNGTVGVNNRAAAAGRQERKREGHVGSDLSPHIQDNPCLPTKSDKRLYGEALQHTVHRKTKRVKEHRSFLV